MYVRLVLIHFQFHVSDFSNKKAVSATRVTICIMVTAQSCTDARARGVQTRRASRKWWGSRRPSTRSRRGSGRLAEAVLQFVQLPVDAASRDQFLVRAGLLQLAVVHHEDAVAALKPCIDQKWLLFSIDSDVCFYPEEQARIADVLKTNGIDCQHITVHSDKGHDAFLLEPESFTPHIVFKLVEVSE